MLDTIILAMRGVQLLFSIIVLGTGGYVASQSTVRIGGITYDFSDSRVSFLIFCAVWTLLVVAYQVLVPRFAEKLAHKFVILAIDAVTMLFWFSGFIALAAGLGYYAGFDPERLGNFIRTAQACVAFAAFTWLAFVVTTVLNAISVFRGDTSHKSNVNPHNGV